MSDFILTAISGFDGVLMSQHSLHNGCGQLAPIFGVGDFYLFRGVPAKCPGQIHGRTFYAQTKTICNTQIETVSIYKLTPARRV